MVDARGDIAIIGAGLAGLTAARVLSRAGRGVRVFDKSRGTGGRLATRRGDHGTFNHGAPVAQGDAAFDCAMADLGIDRCGSGWRGRPGMSGLVKPLSDGTEIVGGCRIVDVAGDTEPEAARPQGLRRGDVGRAPGLPDGVARLAHRGPSARSPLREST